MDTPARPRITAYNVCYTKLLRPFHPPLEVLIAAAALTAEPKPGTTITRTDGTVWVVQGVDQLNPAGTPILYTLWARR